MRGIAVDAFTNRLLCYLKFFTQLNPGSDRHLYRAVDDGDRFLDERQRDHSLKAINNNCQPVN